MAEITREVAEELAACVARNEGLRAAILARGLPLRETMELLQENYRQLFKDAHEEKVHD